MNAADFELNLSLPAQPQFAAPMRELAAHAARYAGCTEEEGGRFAGAVENIVRRCLERAGSGAEVPVIVRRSAGPVEFLIGCEGRFDAATQEAGITIGWTREQGSSMCRVALDL